MVGADTRTSQGGVLVSHRYAHKIVPVTATVLVLIIAPPLLIQLAGDLAPWVPGTLATTASGITTDTGTWAAVAGLGRDGDFHYWNGSFQASGVAWAVDTWYLVGLAFDEQMFTRQADMVSGGATSAG